MALRLHAFRTIARDVMRAAPLCFRYGAPVVSVVEAMARDERSYALVVTAAGQLAGIVTDQDVTRRIAFKTASDAPVEWVMTAPVHAIHADDYVFRAIALMRRHRVRHMPVVDSAGRPVGILDRYEAMSVLSAQFLEQIDALTVDDSIPGLASVKRVQVQLAGELLEADVPAPEVQQLMTDINRDLTDRAVTRALAGLAEEGWGRPPVEFDVLIMGSGGRGESFLNPDQDNGFILEDYPDGQHARIDPFFIALAERATVDLAAIGFPMCRGGVMATNPLWRKSISQWREQTDSWSRKRSFLAARVMGIVLDFRCVHGERRLTQALRDHVTERVGRSPGFLRELQRTQIGQRTALGWFGRLLVETEDQGHRGKINLKMNGVMPMVDAVRLMALAAGIPETSTQARLNALAARGLVEPELRESVDRAFAGLTGLLLRTQIEDSRIGRPVTNHVEPDRLTKRDRDILVDCLGAVEQVRSKVRADYSADVF